MRISIIYYMGPVRGGIYGGAHGYIYMIYHILYDTDGRWALRRVANGRTPRRALCYREHTGLCYGGEGHGGSPNAKAGKIHQCQ